VCMLGHKVYLVLQEVCHTLENSGGEVNHVLFEVSGTLLNIVRRVFETRSQTIDLHEANDLESPDMCKGVRCRDAREAKDSFRGRCRLS